VSAVGDEMPSHATRRQVIAGVLVPRGVRARTNAGRRRQWPSPNYLRPKSDGPHFGFREKWRRSGLTNNFAIPAQTVADLYRYHRQVELFFKWIKQRLRINRSSGPPRTRSKARFGSLSRFTSSSLSSRIALTAIRISTQFYGF